MRSHLHVKSPRQEPDGRPSALRGLPAVHELAESIAAPSHGLAVRAAREAIDTARTRARAGRPVGDVKADAQARAASALRAGPRRVLNATGVVIHTNLGRAPLSERAAQAAAAAAVGYSDLEYDLDAGARGSRQAHVEQLVRELTGAEAALVVNNCAAALLLATTALCAGRSVVISRGQLVEIGGSFRIPEIVAQSGARLVEVGTTNRTRLGDYQRAIDQDTAAVLWVHPSNFRVVGFAQEVQPAALCELGVPVIADLGSGVLTTALPELAGEPAAAAAIAGGSSLVCFSGDKLLGGPQAGVLAGRADAISRCRSHPLARALRIDKLCLSALAATLAVHRDPDLAVAELPVLRMLTAPAAQLRDRAERIQRAVTAAGASAQVVETSARVGGGALPLLELSGPACAVEPGPIGLRALDERLRRGDPPVVGRVLDGRLLLDPRTLTDEEADTAAAAVTAALR
jgi:L-seryl-tRNA(Ser) seleniumtransferase